MRIFSGIQPTGRKHLGNYIGAITQYVAGQDRGEAIYCIVDLHATTVAYEPAVLRERIYDTTALLLAAGLDPERCILFRQGDVAEHAELCWLLSSVTAYGELQRMHQFKDKAAAQRELVSAGLFLYPVLQAADVLAYRADEVPVGDDQRQHVELMRDVAERFNARFGPVLTVPRHRIPPVGARIMDLQAPDTKMATTGGSEQGTVYVLDPPDQIARKLRIGGDRLGRRGGARSGQGGGLQPDRDPGRGAGQLAGGGRARVRRRRLWGLQGGRGRSGDGVSGPHAGALRAAAGRRGRAGGRAGPGGRQGAGDRRADAGPGA